MHKSKSWAGFVALLLWFAVASMCMSLNSASTWTLWYQLYAVGIIILIGSAIYYERSFCVYMQNTVSGVQAVDAKCDLLQDCAASAILNAIAIVGMLGLVVLTFMFTLDIDMGSISHKVLLNAVVVEAYLVLLFMFKLINALALRWAIDDRSVDVV